MVTPAVDPIKQAVQEARERLNPALKPVLNRQELADKLREIGTQFDTALAKKTAAKEFKEGAEALIELSARAKKLGEEADRADQDANETLARHLFPERFTE